MIEFDIINIIKEPPMWNHFQFCGHYIDVSSKAKGLFDFGVHICRMIH